MKEEIQKLIEPAEKEISNMTVKLRQAISENLGVISNETQKYLQLVEEDKKQAKNRFKGFLRRNKFLDIFVILNLILTPILLGVVIYITFFR
jgi:hypothetical protein